MPDSNQAHELTLLLVAAGRAHHQAIGGPNPDWPNWYARHLVDNGIAAHVGFEPTVEQVATWLEEADAKHRAEAPDQPWPPYYAELILEMLEAE